MTETTAHSDPPPEQPEPRRRGRLQRSREERVIAGVCGGLAQHLDVDPLLVRIVVVATLVLGGFGLAAYAAAWLLVPEEGSERPVLGPAGQRSSVQIAAIVVLAMAAIVALGVSLGGGPGFGGGPWPVPLLLVGGGLIWLASRGEREAAGAPAPPRPGGGWAAAGSTPESATGGSHATAATAAPAGADPTGAATPPEVGAQTAPDATAVRPAPAAPTAGAGVVTAFAGGGVLLALGAVGALEGAEVVDLGWTGLAAVAIVLTGVALVASAFFGGARGLIPVGLMLAGVLGGATAAGISLDGGIGETTHRVLHGDDLRGRYELGVGHLVLDLRDVRLARGTTHVEADVAVGQLEIVAPDARFDGDAGGRFGDEWRETGGIDTNRTVVIGDGARRLEIDAHVAVGAIRISGADGDGRPWGSLAPPAAPGGADAPAGPAAPAAAREDGGAGGRACGPLALAAVAVACDAGRDDA